MWFVFALLSAVFAALTSILAKIGIDGVNSNLATAIRTVVVVVMSWGMVFLTNAQSGLSSINRKSWIFLILSGLATGASWLCYYKALQVGDASKVVPVDKLSVIITIVLAFVFLHEDFTAKSIVGCLLIGTGTLLMVLYTYITCKKTREKLGSFLTHYALNYSAVSSAGASASSGSVRALIERLILFLSVSIWVILASTS